MGTSAKAEHDGAFVWDSGINAFASTGPEQFLIRADGGVGIGTNRPRNQLDVRRTSTGAALNANHVAVIENEATNNGHVLALKSNTGTPGSDENFITFKSAVANLGAIEGNGSGGVVYKTTGADFAELLPRLDPSEAIAPGAVVGVFGGLITQQTAGADRLMVVTDRPAVLGNAAEGAEATSNAVAFIGRVPVRVRGPVQVGDWIVASGRGDGIGRAVAPEAWDPARDGPIVGEAWASRAGGTGRVMTAIGLHLRRPLVERLEAQQFTIEDQNRALAEQQKQIDALRGELRSLRDLVRRAD
jgi:hypothetical protein